VDLDQIGSEHIAGSGSELIGRSGSGKNHSGCPDEFEIILHWKTDKIWQFLNENAQFKNKISFYQKYFPKKLISRIKIRNLTH